MIDEGSYHRVIRLVSQADALIIEFFSDETVTVDTIDFKSQEGKLKNFDTFNDFCTWYASCYFTWTSDLGSGARLLVKGECNE